MKRAGRCFSAPLASESASRSRRSATSMPIAAPSIIAEFSRCCGARARDVQPPLPLRVSIAQMPLSPAPVTISAVSPQRGVTAINFLFVVVMHESYTPFSQGSSLRRSRLCTLPSTSLNAISGRQTLPSLCLGQLSKYSTPFRPGLNSPRPSRTGRAAPSGNDPNFAFCLPSVSTRLSKEVGRPRSLSSPASWHVIT